VTSSSRQSSQARSAARRLLVQALYQRLVGGQDWQELYGQYSTDPNFSRADAAYFRQALEAVCNGAESLDLELRHHSDIEPARLDPVEHAILQLGLWELMSQSDIPYPLFINEAVGRARGFGATAGNRSVNAVLYKASRGHRAIDRGEVA
jgi:N utilization substance protein B